MLALLLAGCGSTSGSPRPSQSLIPLDFTLRPTIEASGSLAPPTARPTAVSWPVGWDVAFCNAYADTTVAHELVIDIQRALDDNARDDAQGLTNELEQTAPIAAEEITRIRDWEPALEVRTDLTTLTGLYSTTAAAYKLYFTDGGKSALKDAKQARNQVAKALPNVNEHLQQLADLGLSCPGAGLQLETF